VVFDTVYTPLETRLLKDAGAAGATTVCGLDMFIAQAVGQFERWTALPAPEHLMYRLALERLDPAAAQTAQWRRKTSAG
jgi:shikimate 5-dehydrogenase